VVTVILLAYGTEEYLDEAVTAIQSSTDVTFELIVVDNGTSSPAIEALRADEAITLLTPGRNLGFSGGVNLGSQEATGEYLAFVNSDAVVEPDTLARLVAHLEQNPGVGVAGAAIVLADQPETINNAGQPIHVLGLSWAGMMGRPADDLPVLGEPISASGAAMVIRRDLWEQLGGFDDEYFAYFEDTELCWRVRQWGLDVHVLGDVRVRHHYEFSRSPLKMYLLERNRLLLMLTCFEARTLMALAAPLLAFEAAIGVVAALQGWGRQKMSGWGWILTHQRWLRARRALVQRSRRVPDRGMLGRLATTFDPAQTPMPKAAAPLELLLRAYWGLARRLLRVQRLPISDETRNLRGRR
jgi:GT2 family glycosyltransferase